MSDKTRLILNERFLAFPYGQHTPTSILDAAFELGKKSARLRVDDNPFFSADPDKLDELDERAARIRLTDRGGCSSAENVTARAASDMP